MRRAAGLHLRQGYGGQVGGPVLPSGVEGAADDLGARRLPFRPVDRNDVEATRQVGEARPREERLGHADDRPLLAPRHCRCPAAVGIRSTGLHLDEDDGLVVSGDDVDLAMWRCGTAPPG